LRTTYQAIQIRFYFYNLLSLTKTSKFLIYTRWSKRCIHFIIVIISCHFNPCFCFPGNS